MLFKVKGELLSGNCEASMTSALSESDLELQSKDNTPYFLSPNETIIVLVEQLYRT